MGSGRPEILKMKDENLILLVGIGGIVAYFLYQKWKNTIPARADVTQAPSTLSPGSTLLSYGSTTYKFQEGDWSKLNWAQRFLYGIGISPNLIFQ